MSTGSTTAETGAVRFSRNVAWTLAVRIIIAGGSMVSGVIVARWLGAASVGILASLSVMTVLAINFGGFGFPSAITLLVARERYRLKAVMFNGLVFAFTAGSIMAVGITVLATTRSDLFRGPSGSLVMIAAIAIPFHMLTQFCLACFLGLGEIGRYNLIDLLSQAFLVVNPLVVLTLLGMGLTELVSLNAVTAVFLAVLIVFIFLNTARAEAEGQRARLDMALMREMLGYGSKFYVAMAISMIILRADLLIVNYFRGAAETGVYAVSTQVGTLLMLIPNVISTVLFPRVTEARDTSGEMTCRVTRHTTLLMFVVCLGAIPLAFLLPVLYGPAFAGVPVQVLILLPGVYLLGIETVQVQYFSSLGLPRAIPAFWVITMVVNLTLGLTFVPLYGANAAAAVSSISYALMFALVSTYFRSQTKKTFSEAFLIGGQELRGLLKMGRTVKAAPTV